MNAIATIRGTVPYFRVLRDIKPGDVIEVRFKPNTGMRYIRGLLRMLDEGILWSPESWRLERAKRAGHSRGMNLSLVSLRVMAECDDLWFLLQRTIGNSIDHLEVLPTVDPTTGKATP